MSIQNYKRLSIYYLHSGDSKEEYLNHVIQININGWVDLSYKYNWFRVIGGYFVASGGRVNIFVLSNSVNNY
jgi:hypothetical protein